MAFLTIIVFTAFTCLLRSHALEPAVYCASYTGCQSCAADKDCKWSLRYQQCVDKYDMSSRFTEPSVIQEGNECPRYNASDDSVFAEREWHAYAVKVSNDRRGFAGLLGGADIVCKYMELASDRDHSVGGRVDGDTVVCDPVDLRGIDATPAVFQCVVTFNRGTALRLDRASDQYFTVYPAGGGLVSRGDACRGPRRDDDCATCAWRDERHSNFFRRCLPANRCAGAVEMFYRTDARTHERATAPAGGDAVELRCPDAFAVTADPSDEPWYARTNVTVAVTNHRVLYAGAAAVTVTMAGRECAGPGTAVRGDSVTCALGGGVVDVGPVEVHYALGGARFKLASPNWRYPAVTGVDPPCALAEHGAGLKLSGASLDQGLLRVSAGPAGGCAVSHKTGGAIACRVGPGGAPAAGPVTLTYGTDASAPSLRRVRGPPFRSVAAAPALDAGQSIAGIASGGTRATVRGSLFSCLRHQQVFAELGEQRFEGFSCDATNDTHMDCLAPQLNAPATVGYGVNGFFANRPFRLSPGPESLRYVAHPDPAFTGFHAVNGTVVLRGRDLGRGYGPGDVSAWFADSVATCSVTLVARDRIECEPSVAESRLRHLRELVVAVGTSFSATVHVNPGS